MKPRILFLINQQYHKLEEKGVLHLIDEREEYGFFERVVTVHPVTWKTQTIHRSPMQVIYELGVDWLPSVIRSKFWVALFSPIHMLHVFRQIKKIAIDEKVDLIRATDPYLMGLLGWLVARNLGVPFCVSIHADHEKRFALIGRRCGATIMGSRRLAVLIERMVLNKADMVMPIRETLGRLAVNHGAKEEKIRIIPHGIDMSAFMKGSHLDIRTRFGIEEKTNILSFVGRVTRENYIDDILLMADRLSDERIDFVVVIAGGGADDEWARAQVARNERLSRHVRFLGFQPAEVVRVLRKSSAVSLCLMGGFSLIEACAAGRPVIAYDVEWHYELVKNNETGFLIEEHDIDGLVDAIRFLLDHPDEADKLGNNAREFSFQRHELKASSNIKRQCYQELLNVKGAFHGQG